MLWRAYMQKKRLTPEGRAYELFNSARQRARAKGDRFTITREWVEVRVLRGVCEVTGLPFSLASKRNYGAWSPSLDKKNPSKGYTPQNTQVVCWCYNAAKGQNEHEDVLRMAEALWRTHAKK